MSIVLKEIILDDEMDAAREYDRPGGVTGLASYLEDTTGHFHDQRRLILNLNEEGDDQQPSPSLNAINNRSNPFDPQPPHHDLFDYSQHCHQQFQAPHDKTAQKTLILISLLTIVFIVGEVVGGVISDSLAILTDAAHMLSDLASFLISLFAVWFARKPATRKMSFGYYRAEVLGAVCSIFIIWILTGILVYVAVLRVQHPETIDINPDAMLGTACAGVAFNIIMGLVLFRGGGSHGHSHGGGSRSNHSHGHSHAAAPITTANFEPIGIRQRTISINAYPNEEISHVNKTKNINIRAAFIHVIGDLAQSVGVVIAAIIIKIKPTYVLADPICTFIFSAFVVLTTVTVLRDAIMVLMECTPPDVDYTEVRTSLEQITGVKAAHSLHMWSLTMDKAALAVHLAIDTSFDSLEVMHKASRMMKFKYNLQFTTIQVEPYDRNIMRICPQCVGPLC